MEDVTEGGNKYGGGMYFPSGAPQREERRQEDEIEWERRQQDGRRREDRRGQDKDGWTNLSGEKVEDNPPSSQGREDRKDEEPRPFTPRDLETQPTEQDPITEENFLLPVEKTTSPRDFGFPEDERTRRPWLPNMNTDIKSFDDLFSNAIDDSLAQGRTSGGVGHFLNITVFNVIVSSSLLLLLFH